MIKSILAGASALAMTMASGIGLACAADETGAAKAAAVATAPAGTIAPASAGATTTIGTVLPTAATPAAAGVAAASPVAAEMQPTAADAAAPAVPPPTSKPVPETTLRVSIDLSNQRMVVSEQGNAIHTWPISSGRGGYRTPTGTYKPQWMSRMHYSRKYDYAPMPYSVFFHGGYAIHGTYATGMLGRPASHGCVRLAPGNAKTLFNLVSRHGRQHTVISLSGSAPSSGSSVAHRSKRRSNTYSSYSGSSSGLSFFWFGSDPAPVARKKRPKVIYRNGQPYVYVGGSAAKRARQKYSGSYYNY